MVGITEDTVSDLVASYLRREGINALTQFTVDFPKTWGKPDIKLEDGGYFFGEAEWDGKEWDGFGEARDYLQAPNATGTFLITYPTELKKELSQARLRKAEESRLSMFEPVLSKYEYKAAFLRPGQQTDMRTLEWKEIPQWFRVNIELKKEPAPDLDWTISILRQTAETLTKELGDVKEPELFRSILGSSSGTKKQERAASEASGYLLTNQIAFYRILSSVKDLPEIRPEELTSPQDLSKYFSKVLEINYSPVFSYPIASAFSQKSLTILKSAIKSIYALSPERIGHEALGRVFHELIPLSIRKSVAAYYTKNKAGRILAELSIDKPNAKVMDPACGSGTLLSHSYNKKRELSEEFEEEDHRRFVEEDIIGIDIMPFASHLSTINLSLEAPEYPTDAVRIGIEDSTKLEPGKSIPPLSRILPEDKKQRQLEDWAGRPAVEDEKIERGVVGMDALPGKEIEFEKVDNIIMNPPFTRQETIADFSKEYKDTLEKRFPEANKKGLINRKMSYCSYFLLLADKFLKDGGRIAAVLPASILRKDTTRNLRKYLLKNYNIEYIIAREDEPNFSEDTDFREILFILKKGKSQSNKVSFLILTNYEDLYLSHLKSVSKNAQTEFRKDTNFELRVFQQNDLDVRNMFRQTSASDYSLIELWNNMKKSDFLSDFRDLEIDVKEGARSRKGGRYPEMSINKSENACMKKRDVWFVNKVQKESIIAKNRFTNDEVEIPSDNLHFNLRRISGRKTIDFSNLNEFVVFDEFKGSDHFISVSGEKGEFTEKWKKYLNDRLSNFAIAFRFDMSAEGTKTLAYFSSRKRIWPGVTWSILGLNNREAKITSLWYNSTINLLQLLIERMPTRGAWTQFHKYIIQKLNVLNPSKLSEKSEQNLIEIFQSVKDIEFPALWKQLAMNSSSSNFSDEEIKEFEEIFEDFSENLGRGFEPRRKIDQTILDILGYSEEEKKELLNQLYPGLLKEIGTLKRMMS